MNDAETSPPNSTPPAGIPQAGTVGQQVGTTRASPVYPPSPPLDEEVDRFWEVGPEFDAIEVCIEPPNEPLALLEQLGTSPFDRGEFPLIGFLATTYDKVSRYALGR